tara:strand:+ start:1224 stop:1931 length:708 start_codon:yes stop_codon:yes gene_type:complete
MSQHDLNIANQLSGPTRSDINNALQALNSNNSGATSPTTTTKANMHWYDTSTNTLKQRSEEDDAWISIGYFDQSSNAFKVFDDTMVVDASGTQTGIIGDQATSAWEAGTGTTQSLVSPANVKAAVDSLVVSSPIKAWARFSYPIDSAASIQASDNIASITYIASGEYQVTFSTALQDAYYCATGNYTQDNNNSGSGDDGQVKFWDIQSTGCKLSINNGGGGKVNTTYATSILFVR